MVYLSSMFFITNFISSCPEEPPLAQGFFAQEMITDWWFPHRWRFGFYWTDEHIETLILTGISSLSQEIPDLKSKSHYYSLHCNCPEAVWPVTKLMIDNKKKLLHPTTLANKVWVKLNRELAGDLTSVIDFSFILFLKDLFILYWWVSACMHVCVPHVWNALEDQKRALVSLEPEL